MNHIIILGIIIGVIGIITLIVALILKNSDHFQLVSFVAFSLIALGIALVFIGRTQNDVEDFLKEENLNKQNNEAETMERHDDEYTEIHYYEEYTDLDFSDRLEKIYANNKFKRN